MTNGYVRYASEDDIQVLAENMRKEDIAEIKAASGQTPEAALTAGLRAGTTKVACLPSGTPVVIFGIAPVAPRVGAAWLLAADDMKLIQGFFLRECRNELAKLSVDYDLLFNYADARNTVHHRWIKWMGFTIIKKHETHGHEGRPFLEFVKLTEGTPCVIQ